MIRIRTIGAGGASYAIWREDRVIGKIDYYYDSERFYVRSLRVAPSEPLPATVNNRTFGSLREAHLALQRAF